MVATDASAVLEAIRNLALQAQERYCSLGPEVLEWALSQSLHDAKSSRRALELFFTVHGVKVELTDREEAYFRDLWLSGNFIPIAKWCTASFLASHAGHDGQYKELPPRPEILGTQVGPLMALFPSLTSRDLAPLRTRLTERTKSGSATRRAKFLSWSFLGLKDMMPPMWVDQISKSLFDHAGLLGSPPPALPDSSRSMLELVAHSVARIAYGKDLVKYSELGRPKLSSSAGWVKLYDEVSQRWTSMHGTRAAQHERFGLIREPDPLYSMDFNPRVGVVEFRQEPYQFRWDDWDFEPSVSVVALQEPFKIRTISIADGPSTAAGSVFQKRWHKALKSLRPFSLVGGARVADVVGMFQFDGTPFVSGDYSAATDRLSLNATKVVFDALLSHVAIDPELESRLRLGLTGAVLDYSRTLEQFRKKIPETLFESIRVPDRIWQNNGQLMGNILSFPILCIVNLAGYLEAFEGSGGPVGDIIRRAHVRGYLTKEDFDALPVLVNGDDILFQAQPLQYQRWREIISNYGFKLSVGKNYYSSEFFTINSELYTVDGFLTRPWWGGFSTDAMRIRQELRFETGVDVLSADMRLVLPPIQLFLRESVPLAIWPRVNRLWLEHQRDLGLLSAYKGLNWFLPQPLGGIGLDPTGWGEYELTYAQRKLAAKLLLDPEGLCALPGIESSLLTERSRKTARRLFDGTWMTGEVVEKDGRKYILDRDQPLRVFGTKIFFRAHPTVSDLVEHSSHIDGWMDYHVTGTRFDTDRARTGVTKLLRWGLRLSDVHLDGFDPRHLRPRLLCSRRVHHISASDLH